MTDRHLGRFERTFVLYQRDIAPSGIWDWEVTFHLKAKRSLAPRPDIVVLVVDSRQFQSTSLLYLLFLNPSISQLLIGDMQLIESKTGADSFTMTSMI
jgi:hypothetical protein